jgi:hypothetical protein
MMVEIAIAIVCTIYVIASLTIASYSSIQDRHSSKEITCPRDTEVWEEISHLKKRMDIIEVDQGLRMSTPNDCE